jgi:predicted nucleic acid-binding protein
MKGKAFLDTNIFFYSFDSSAPAKRKRSIELIESALKEGSGIISYQVVQEFMNVSLHKFAVPLKPEELQIYLANVLRPLCQVSSSISLFDLALRMRERYGFTFYDALIVAAAIEADCDRLLSEDMQDGLFIERTVRIENPFRS